MINNKKVSTEPAADLIGMWAYIWQGNILHERVFFLGKADDGYYIVQSINALSAEPNTARIVHVSQMTQWQILPTKQIADMVLEDYLKSKKNRFTSDLISYSELIDMPFKEWLTANEHKMPQPICKAMYKCLELGYGSRTVGEVTHFSSLLRLPNMGSKRISEFYETFPELDRRQK